MKNTARGFVQISGPSGSVERETFTCRHCNAVHVVPVKAIEEAGGFCRQCFGMICPNCTKHGRCTPFEKKLAEQEQRNATLRSLGF